RYFDDCADSAIGVTVPEPEGPAMDRVTRKDRGVRSAKLLRSKLLRRDAGHHERVGLGRIVKRSSFVHRTPGCNVDVDTVLLLIVDKKSEGALLQSSIDGHSCRIGSVVVRPFGSPYHDLVVGLTIPVAHREFVPRRRQARRETKSIPFERESQ